MREQNGSGDAPLPLPSATRTRIRLAISDFAQKMERGKGHSIGLSTALLIAAA